MSHKSLKYMLFNIYIAKAFRRNHCEIRLFTRLGTVQILSE